MNLYNMKHLNNIKFSLKNSHGALISSLGDDESDTTGNLNFSMVLKVDIIERPSRDKTNFGEQAVKLDPKLKAISTTAGGLGRY